MDIVMRILFVMVFVGLGSMLLFVGIREHFRQDRLLEAAQRVEAEIIESRVDSSTTSDNDPRLLRSSSTTSYTPFVRFRYRIAGTEFESTMLYPTIIERGSPSEAGARSEIAEFPVGARVAAFVDPSNPGRGFLRASASAGPLGFVVAGLGCFGLLAIILRFI